MLVPSVVQITFFLLSITMLVPSVVQMTFFEYYYAGALCCADDILSLSITMLVTSVLQMTFLL